jgi:drug/metabolite transporter, DME family
VPDPKSEIRNLVIQDPIFRDESSTTGLVLAFTAGILWSLAGVFIKSLDLHPIVIAFYRSFFAMLFFVPFFRARSLRFTPALIVSGVAFTIATGSFVWATKLTTAANAIVLQNTAPAFIFVIVYVFFRERITRSNLLTLLLGMAGIVIIFAGHTGEQDLHGVLVAILSGVMFSVYFVNLRFLQGYNPAVLMLINNLFSTVTLMVLAYGQWNVSLTELALLVVMGVVQFAMAHFLFFRSLEMVSLQEASLISLVEPVLNPVWVALWVGEIPSTTTFIGGAVILLGLMMRYLGGSRLGRK